MWAYIMPLRGGIISGWRSAELTLCRRACSAGGYRQAGFTLLEILVAITLLALVAGTMTLGLQGAGRALEEAERQGEMDRQVSRTLQRLHDDLAAVPRAAALDLSAAARSGGDETGELLRCVTRAGVDFQAEREVPLLVRVQYRLLRDAQHPGSLLLYRAQAAWAPSGEESGEEHLLCRDLRRLTCSFQDGEGVAYDHWPPVEDEVGSQELLPPAQVNCRLERWLDEKRGLSSSFSLAVLLPTGTGPAEGAGLESAPLESPAPKIRRR